MRSNRQGRKTGLLFLLLLVGLTCLTGCRKEESCLEDYSIHFQKSASVYMGEENEGMAQELAVVMEDDTELSSDVKAALTVNEDSDEVLLSYHAFERMYPASITKVMTALLTLEEADFEEEVTLEHDIVFDEGNVVRSGLKKGDTVTVEGLFNALLVASDNDCAVILAEHIAGSVTAFTEKMNLRAKELGATHTHFVNANGLHDEDHYTTAYDLYLIFREAMQYDRFTASVSQKDYTLEYTNGQGNRMQEYMVSTNAYFNNTYAIPTGIDIVGGKTGTTSAARSCLILCTRNKQKELSFSVVLGAETKNTLYHTMSELICLE